MVWAVLNPDQNVALTELIEGQKSDRIVAIIGGAMLDDSLRQALELRLRPKDGETDMNDLLFKPAGPLGNMVPKIQLAYQLWMLDKPARNTMSGIAQIRNMFAHNLSMTFDSTDPKIVEGFKKLVMHKGRTHYPSPIWDGDTEHELETTETRRDVFIVNLQLVLLWLMGDHHKHQPWNNTPTGVTYAAPKKS